jgi:mannosyltransferase OCH1-like enzyme
MIPRIVHQTSGRLTREEGRLARRIRRLLAGWEYRFWSDEDNETLVKENFPDYYSEFKSVKRGVVKADIVRYMYMSVYGGFYLDTDYKLFLSIDDEMLSHPCILPISRDSNTLFRLGNAIFGSEPGHAFWNDFLEQIFSSGRLADLSESSIEKTTGPEALTKWYVDHRDSYKEIFLPSREVFHPPISHWGFSFQRGPTTIGGHLCWSSWRTKGVFGRTRLVATRLLTSF